VLRKGRKKRKETRKKERKNKKEEKNLWISKIKTSRKAQLNKSSNFQYSVNPGLNSPRILPPYFCDSEPEA
jgi:hypothetical protein